jgi:pyruvate,orthophosphate dikinase
MKFDCLGLTFRLETLVNVLFEDLIRDIDLNLITKATFYQIYSLLRLLDKALKLDGISSVEVERQLEFLAHSLEVKGFTQTQYLDIFKGFAQAVKNIIHDHFHNIHGQNLNRILSQIPIERVLPKFLPSKYLEDREKLQHRVSEIFFREQIALSLGLQQLDFFLSRILTTLFQQSKTGQQGHQHGSAEESRFSRPPRIYHCHRSVSLPGDHRQLSAGYEKLPGAGDPEHRETGKIQRQDIWGP